MTHDTVPHPAAKPLLWTAIAAFIVALVTGIVLSDRFDFRAATLEAAEPPPTPAQLYDRVLPAVVEILVDDHLNGSGWIADAQGHVFTAAHVVAGDRKRFEVVTAQGKRIDATLVALDLGHDLALLRLATSKEPYPALPAAAKSPEPGETIYLFGSPIYRHAVMIDGIVARRGVAFEYLPDQQSYIEMMHVAADSPRGTSGGAWVNAAGQVVGLQSGMMRDNNAQVGIAFVTPVDAIRNLLDKKENAATMSIGAAIEEMWEQPWDFLRKFPARTEGIVIRSAHEGGPAAKAGLVESDVIVSVNGTPVRFRDEFMRQVLATRPGKDLKLRVLTAGQPDQPRTVMVTPKRLEKP